MAIGKEEIDNWFTYHAPSNDQVDAFASIRAKAKDLALTIIQATPPSADQRASIRLLRECVMTANAAIACGGK